MAGGRSIYFSLQKKTKKLQLQYCMHKKVYDILREKDCVKTHLETYLLLALTRLNKEKYEVLQATSKLSRN